MNCRLIDDTEFLNDLNNIVMSTSEELDPISSFKTEIIRLKSKYRDSSEFEDAVKEYLEDDLGFYNISLIDEKIADDFRNSIDDIFKENPPIEEGESKLDSLSPNTNVSLVRGQFLNRYFAGVSSSKLVFLKNFKNQVIRKLFIKEDEGESSLITSLEEVNESLQNYRESLKSIVADFLRSKVNDNAAKTFEYLFDNNMYAAIRHLDKIYKNTYTFPISLIARLPEYSDPNSKLTSQLRKTLEAWQAYIILSNFDDLLSISLGKSIEIKNHGEYNLDNSKKYRLKTADKVIHTWKDDNVDVDETEELGSLAVLFLESLNIYDKSGPTNDTLNFANIKVSIGQLMKILDVLPNTKFLDETVSDKTYSYEIKPILKSEYSNIYGDDYLNYLLDTYVVGKTFKLVLAFAKLHPQILMPLLFRLTQPILDSLGNYNPYSNLFNRSPKTAETIRSLYYLLFSPESDSLFSMNTKRYGFDPNALSIFLYITTTFLNIENKLQLEYQKTEDGIIAINLGEKMRNDRLKNFQRALEAKFTKTNPLSTKIGNIHKFFNFEIEDNLDSKSGNKGITISFDNYKIKVNPDFTILISDSENNPIKDSNIYEKFIPIYQEVLDMEFDIRTLSILAALKGTLKEVMELTSHMLYNFIVSKHMMNTTNNTYEEEVKNYYTLSQILKNYPKSAYNSILPSIIIGTEYNGILTTLSKVKDIIEGYSEINSVKDGERKLISTLGLSMLLSKYNEVIENYGKREDSPIKHFSIYDLFEGAELMRDYAESGNNKLAKKFTEPELVTISFIYDMYGDMYELDESGENLVVKNGGTLRVMGPVVSDKNNLIKLRFNWDAPIPEKYRQLLGRENSNERITLRNLNNEDLKTIIKLEFGEYYLNVYNYIKSQWNILNEILEGKSQNYIDEAIDSLELELPKGKLFDWDSNFLEANLYYGNQTLSILRRAIYLAQQDGNNIEIIDLVHYRKGKDGKILNNPSLIHQLQIFGKLPDGELYEEFWNRKEKLLFIDFLLTETELLVKEGNVPKKGVAIKAALQHNDGWIKGENIAIAKIHENDWTRVIATKTDFKEWFSYKRMRQYYGNNLPSNLNIDSPDANLTDILNEIAKNNLKYKVIENLDTISKKNKLYDYKNLSEEQLLALAKNLYSTTRLKYNPNLTSEDIQTSFDKKIEKDFTKKNGKIDTKVLIEYINRKTILNDIDIRFSDVYGIQELDISYLEKYIPELDNISVELNPEIIKHNLLDFYLSEEFILSTTGTHVSQPSKIEDNIIEREAEQFGLAVKRYVAYTASKHREEANTLNGITEDINISIIEDDYDFSYNYAGETGKVKVFDGASFYNITMNYLDNNSLGADAMGIDKKPFAHYQGVKSGIGFILKTAGFAMTNDRIRSSKFDARMNKLMLDLKWDSAKVQKIINPNWNSSQKKYIPDWTKDYNGNTIDYGEWFAYRKDKKGNWHWYKHRINNGNVEYKQVLNNGTPLNSEDSWKIYKKCSDVNSNYELWEVFGGAYSGHLLKNSNGTETLVYENDESSALKLVLAINNVGIKKSINGKQIDKVFDLDGVNLYLKKAMIHIIATEGAVKYGGANINSKEAYHKNDYNLTYMTIKSYDLGELLDAEHSAEDGKVSLMTLVVNALGARGYTSYEAKECYEALANIAEYITGDILRAMETDDPDLIDSVMSKSIYKTLLKTSDLDGDMLNALAESLLGDINSSSFNKEEIVLKFPISHPAVYNKVLSSLASLLEKGIRLKFKGGMLVLNPSNKRMTVINGHLSGYYDTHLDELKKLEENSKLNSISSIADIKLGYNYRNVLTGELVQINKPTDIYQLKESINNGNTYYETFIDDDGYPLGRDLSTYQSSFEDIEGNRYNSWELDSVRMLLFLQEGEKDGKKVDIGFLIPPSKTDEDKISFQLRLQENWDKLNTLQKAWNIYINPEFLELLNVEQLEEASRLLLSDEIKEMGIRNWLIRRFLKELNALSSGIETEVEVDGKVIQVNKSKTKVHPYGVILPMIYKSIFGLKELDNLSNIKNDRNFFIKRLLENWKSKITDLNVYDLELKTLDGNHIYLGLPLGVLMDSTTYQEVELEFPTNFELDENVLYRVTPLGERLYSVPYTIENGNIIPDIQVYKHKATGTEIIYSSNLTHFLDEFNYNQIIISQRDDSTKPNSLESIDKVELLKAINASTNKVARRKINTITRVVSNIVNRKSNNLTNVEDSIIDIIENDSDSENVRGLLNNLIGYESDEPYSLEELILFDKEILESFINSDYTYHEKLVEKLQEDLNKNLFGLKLIDNNKFFKGLILSGLDVHTSFLQSLEMIVSRTPAQSQQSFMSMVVEAFGLENKNSAYVSRDLLWLLGSDYDIDKISLLGLIFSFGKLKTWSPFFSLKNNESFNASKKLPFPTQKELGTVKLLSETERLTLHRLRSQENLSDRQLNNLLELESRDIQKIPYDVLRNNLTVINPTESENGEMVISTPSRHSLIINQTPEGIVMITASDWESTPPLELYILTRRMKEALKNFNGPLAFTNFDLLPNTRQALGITSENIMSLNRDVMLDYMEFNRAILGDINYKSFNVKHIQDNIIELAPNLGILINAYNKLGIIPELNQQEHLFIKSLVDYHNTSIKGSSLMDGLYNFISIKIKDISNDVINKVLGQAPIDPEMDKVKTLVKDAKEYPENLKLAGFMKKFDRGSVYSKYKMLILTLSGKEEVGIEASSLKNFEISSLYNYQTLEEGTLEELEDLLFDIRINGRRVQMLANSYARNPDTVKSEKVREVLKRINLVSDAFLTKSGLLSLSTDNAKDPTLPKLNCGPKMISLYNAGVIVGLSVDELTKLLLSDTGILINKLAESNIFTGKLEKSRVIDIIRYLQRPPSTFLTDDLLNTMTPLFKELGLLRNEEKLNKTKLGKILLNKATRSVLLLIFNFLLSPNENSSLLKIDKEGVINNIINSLKGHKDYTGFSYRASKYLEDLEKIENKTKLLEETYLSLKEKRDKKAVIEDLIKSWKYYNENGITGLPGNNVETINEILEFDLLNLGVERNSSSLDKTISNLRSNIYENKYYLSLIKEIYNWLSYQNIIEEKVLGEDGFKHNVLYQLLKLAEIAEEQSVLRPLMALNQGLPNKVEESMKFYTDFSKIISDRLEILGKEKAQQDPKTLELLQKLSEFNGRLRQQGVINSDDEHYIDLHTYLYDKEYNNIVKNLYGKIKSTTNIFRVVEGVANYKTYLRLADAQVQISLKKSLKYRTSKYIEDKIIPLFNTRKSSNLLLMRKNISSYIDRDLNTLYLLSLKIQVKIPRFKIIEGNLQLLEGKPETILLGINKKNDLKFKLYVEFILFPRLKNKYPGNDFLSYIGYRNYDYNDDHNSSINLSKIKTSNMKNASDVVQFNLAKLGLTELSSEDITSLFYYNLIAYNNLPGQSSLTSLFEDILRNNRLQAVVNYNEFISNWDKINTISEYNSVEIMKAIAPILKISEVRSSLKIPYFYCLNPETKITYLCYKINSNEGDNEFDDEFYNNYYNSDENDNKASFETIIRESGYGIYGLVTPDIEGKPVEMLKVGKYIISNSTLENMQIMDGEKVYSVTDILKIAKEKGFKIEGKNKINPSDIFARLKSSKKYNLDLIESYLNTILYDKPCK